MSSSNTCKVTENDLIKANPEFFLDTVIKAMGYHIPKIKQKNGKHYYFVRYENHTTVYNIHPDTFVLTYRAHIEDGAILDLNKLL